MKASWIWPSRKHIWIHLNPSLKIDLGGEIIVLIHIRRTLS